MKRYIIKITAFALALILPFALMLGIILATPDKPNDSLPYTLHYKLDLLQDTQAPRVIIAGGSASEYGINCRQITQATGQPAICIGVTVYIGLEIYLGMLEKYARPGDTVILMLENSILRENSVDYSLLWAAIGSDLDAWAVVPPAEWPNLVRTAWRYCKERVEKNGGLFAGGWRPAVYDGYHSDIFGPWGDVIEDRPESLLASGYNTQDPIELGPDTPDSKKLKKICSFIKKMEKKGVRVFFAHAPLDRLCVTSDRTQNNRYAAAVEQKLDIPVLMPIDEAIMPPEYFYNSNNHLTSPGAEIYTAALTGRLIELIQQ